MNKRNFLIVLLGAFILTCLSGCSRNPRSASAEEDRSKTETSTATEETVRPLLIIAEEFIPYAYMENGRIVGIEAEIVGRIMDRLGVPYEMEILPWARGWKMVQNGDVEAVLGTSYKTFRESYFYFTQEQKVFPETGKMPPDLTWVTEYVFFVKKIYKNSIKFESWEQMKSAGWRVGVIRENSYFDEFFAADLDLHASASARDCFKKLISGEIDIYLQDKTVGLATLKDMGFSNDITYIPEVLFRKPYMMPFAKKSDYPGLRQIMDRFYDELRKMRTSGEYQEIYDKYTQPAMGIGCPEPGINVEAKTAEPLVGQRN